MLCLQQHMCQCPPPIPLSTAFSLVLRAPSGSEVQPRVLCRRTSTIGHHRNMFSNVCGSSNGRTGRIKKRGWDPDSNLQQNNVSKMKPTYKQHDKRVKLRWALFRPDPAQSHTRTLPRGSFSIVFHKRSAYA